MYEFPLAFTIDADRHEECRMWNPVSVDLSLTIVFINAHRPLSVFDSGVYLVSKTIFVPTGAQIVGDMYPTILGSGTAFQDQTNPTPVLQVRRLEHLRLTAHTINVHVGGRL